MSYCYYCKHCKQVGLVISKWICEEGKEIKGVSNEQIPIMDGECIYFEYE